MTRRRRHLLSQVHLSKRTKDISGAPLFCYIEKGNPGGGGRFPELEDEDTRITGPAAESSAEVETWADRGPSHACSRGAGVRGWAP